MKHLFKYSMLGLIGLSLILFSCEKEEPSFTEISGQVFEYGTNQEVKVSNALVFFQWRVPKTYGAEIYLIDTVRTDGDGRYTIKANAPDKNLYVFASASNYYDNGDLAMLPNIIHGKSQTVNMDLIPHSWIKITAKNTGVHSNMNINTPMGALQGHQISSDTIIIAGPVYGNSEVELQIFKYQNGLNETESHIVKTIAHDTVSLEVSF